MPGQGVQDFVLIHLGQSIYAMGGWNGYTGISTDTSAVSAFNGTTWTTMSNMMSGPIHAHAATTYGLTDTAFVCGGMVKGVSTATCYTYSTKKNTWAVYAHAMTTTRSWHGMAHYNGRLEV
jgi:hypothetical protein